jgi:LPXTG-motif cell wall-anchored protein
MIKVEDVVNKNAEKESEKYRSAGAIPGTVKEVHQGSYWPWIGVIFLAGLAAWYFLFRKKGSGNEGVSG